MPRRKTYTIQNAIKEIQDTTGLPPAQIEVVISKFLQLVKKNSSEQVVSLFDFGKLDTVIKTRRFYNVITGNMEESSKPKVRLLPSVSYLEYIKLIRNKQATETNA